MNKCIIKTATVALVTMSVDAALVGEEAGRKDPARLLLSIEREDQQEQNVEDSNEGKEEEWQNAPTRRRLGCGRDDKEWSDGWYLPWNWGS